MNQDSGSMSRSLSSSSSFRRSSVSKIDQLSDESKVPVSSPPIVNPSISQPTQATHTPSVPTTPNLTSLVISQQNPQTTSHPPSQSVTHPDNLPPVYTQATPCPKQRIPHFPFDVCDCQDCLDELFELECKEEKQRKKKMDPLQKRYEAGDPHVGLLGDPSGKFDYYVLYGDPSPKPEPLPCKPSPSKHPPSQPKKTWQPKSLPPPSKHPPSQPKKTWQTKSHPPPPRHPPSPAEKIWRLKPNPTPPEKTQPKPTDRRDVFSTMHMMQPVPALIRPKPRRFRPKHPPAQPKECFTLTPSPSTYQPSLLPKQETIFQQEECFPLPPSPYQASVSPFSSFPILEIPPIPKEILNEDNVIIQKVKTKIHLLHHELLQLVMITPPTQIPIGFRQKETEMKFLKVQLAALERERKKISTDSQSFVSQFSQPSTSLNLWSREQAQIKARATIAHEMLPISQPIQPPTTQPISQPIQPTQPPTSQPIQPIQPPTTQPIFTLISQPRQPSILMEAEYLHPHSGGVYRHNLALIPDNGGVYG